MTETISIETLGAKGDGIGRGAGGLAYVPYSLPGERVLARRSGQRATIEEIELASPERRDAPCPHFTLCGGCELQHASPAVYSAFKRDLVIEAYRRVSIETEVQPLVPCAPASRRRAVFSAVRAGPRLMFGFHEAMSNRIVPIETCLVVVPEIVAAFEPLRRLSSLMLDRKGETRLTVAATGQGLDVAIETGAKLNDKTRAAAISATAAAGIARLSVNGEILIEYARPMIMAGTIPVSFPPGGFLQAVASAETAMAELVTGHMTGLKTVADLFSGIGTFALRLARNHATHAVESDAPALAVMDQARRVANGLKPLTAERRDLFRRPLTRKELSRFEGVVFDPPRAGAEAQAIELAASSVQRVAAVSCNPLTLARDVKLLLDGGFRLVSTTPIDQFLWSHHVEAVALLVRDK
ncbi:class I SAM-dependent RNA methyltransferase [Aureimonas fodinaquatilis]|uniref:Class I SAM-dependent RNA methyltransferase n=1 Tax=Aureimonas fodinaquatilis TaxID=2565783 RepID=A0A5B0E4V9_9HYPH|nr:class I SAM-dependent RNA methyltransferase [Aureimonas fodinaquatilis]KAA0972469.1 class I SAM-dependent RNA methyltransferase [Aureimonas fodinaquatilis]